MNNKNINHYIKLTSKILIITLLALVVFVFLLMVRFWVKGFSQKEVIGVSFSQVQAERYSSNWRDNYNSILTDLGFKHVRIAAYWDRIEPEPGKYDWSELDYMVEQARANNAKLTMVIGQKSIRVPECYYPRWLNKNHPKQVKLATNRMLAAVVGRYENETAIEAWQLENEFLLRDFGDCPSQNLTNEALAQELDTVKKIDNTRPVIITQSNQFGWPVFGPVADIFGFSMYRWVWSPLGYYRYPQTGLYNWFKAATISFYTGNSIKVHELQAEPWDKVGNENLNYKLAEQTMNPRQLAENLEYARQSQIKRIDLWGSEWWYAVKNQGHPEMWEAVKLIKNK